MSTNSEERMRILRMIEENRITADQGALLLGAIEQRREEAASGQESTEDPETSYVGEQEETPPAPSRPLNGKKPRWFRVEVSDSHTGKSKVHVRLPLSLVNIGLKIGSRFTDELNGIDTEELVNALSAGGEGKLVEVTDEEDGEHVEIFVE
jgi:hypothetical protein